ncbi:MAG TPA: aromatic ring-hydroxylating dioxygenase subunit alpha [Pilimelia sp.]|nr:aromatic ring-hydroxylating dioxygenase subunit alpha [Pilimelia sp.]
MDELERRLLRRVWMPVARLTDLADSPVLGARILDTSLVVYRIDDQITVADGACPHRGAAMWTGTLDGDTLRCPYHGWRFAGGTGACVEVPSLPPDAPLPRVSLRTYPVRTAYDHVWTCLDDPYLPFPDLPSVFDASWRTVAGRPLDVGCGLRTLTENFRDAAHFPFVHVESLGKDVPQIVNPYQVVRDGWELTWSVTLTSRDGAQEPPTEPFVYNHVLPAFTTIRILWPDGFERVLGQVAVPVTAEGDRVRLFWFAGERVDASTGEVSPRFGAGLISEEAVFLEDIRVVEQIVPTEAPLSLTGQAHTRADRFSIAYRQAYRELLDEFAKGGDRP